MGCYFMGAKVIMAASDHVHPSQHMNKAHIKSATSHKETRQMLEKLIDNDVKFLLSHKKNHLQLKIIGDGLVAFSSSPSDSRGLANNKAIIQRSIRQHIDPEWRFPD
jgi:hypothetical protein